MTNADQKATIRERVASTGENYTTAKRAIEQARSHAQERVSPQRPAGLIPSGRHRLRIAEPLVQSGHWHAHRRTFPIASEPSAMSTRNPARNHRRAPDQPSEGCGRGEGRVSDGADGRGGFPLHRTGERVQHLPVVAAGCQLAEKTSNYLTLAYG